MRIAQVAPLYESVPPKYYGGTERVVSYLTEELVQQGHDVTLFASGDSITSAQLAATTRRSLRLDEHCVDQLAHHVLMLERVVQRAASRRGISVVFVDAPSFVGRPSAPEPGLLRLQSLGIPVTVLRRGDDLAARLSAGQEAAVG